MSGFPENIIEEVKQSLTDFMPKTTLPDQTQVDVPIIERPLRFSDPERSIGVHPVDWQPVQQSAQIGQQENALARYLIRIQNMVKHTDEIEGRAMYNADAKMIRVILYRDQGLRVRLGELNETLLDTIERFKRMGIQTQRFMNNELSTGSFVYLATTDLWVETEITQL